MILYLISIVLALFLFLWNAFKIPLVIILIMIAIYIIINEFRNRKYLRNPFKKTKEFTELDMVEMIIDSLTGYKKVLKTNHTVIAILSSGVYYLKVTNAQNEIKGDLKEPYLYRKFGDQEFQIKNPLLGYEQEVKAYQNKLQEEIVTYLIIRNDCFWNVINNEKIKILRIKNLHYQLDKTTKKYTNNQIDKIYSKLIM